MSFMTENLKFTVNGGLVIIEIPEKEIEDGLYGKKLVTMPLHELKSFFLDYLRQLTIENLRIMTDDQLEAWFTCEM